MHLEDNLSLDRYRFAEERTRALAVPGKRGMIFDIGPGNGLMRSLAGNDFEWIGLDREAWGDVVRWDLTQPCPLAGKRADVVLLLDVIEHLPNPGLALSNISDAMNDGATLIMTTPNPRWSGSRINALVKGELSSFSKYDLDENYHVLPIWPHVLEQFLGEAGLVPQSYVTLYGRTKLFEFKGRLGAPKRLVLNVLQKIIEAGDATSCGSCYGMVATKSAASPRMVAYQASSSPAP